MAKKTTLGLLALAGLVAAGCGPKDFPNALVLSLSRFEKGAGGAPKPHSELVFLRNRGGKWAARDLRGPGSTVFHKALLYQPPGGAPALLTLGGRGADRPRSSSGASGPKGLAAETLWETDFGGKFSRMRDAEVADLDGDGTPEIAVATHDQGVVAIVKPGASGGFAATELDREAEHLRARGRDRRSRRRRGARGLRHAERAEPARRQAAAGQGGALRAEAGQGRAVVADLGDRHAKEILVADVDGDGRDELYVSVEAAEGGSPRGPALRRRHRSREGGVSIATLYDPMCRFLTAGDVDGDGKKEMVAAAKDSGVSGCCARRRPEGAPGGRVDRQAARRASSTRRSPPTSTATAGRALRRERRGQARCGATRGTASASRAR